MPDIEAQNPPANVANPYEEETKLGSTRDRMWTLYMKQAGAFDRHMVEDWKGVMEGTLIFAGLFSAVVTTFMVESLRKLTRDGSPSNPPLANYEVLNSSPSYIAINALWSLSLAFSIGCAIAATLVQQWARSYLHAVDNQHQPPHKRALIRAYMYEGLGASHMTIAIEGIPILLHASLFLFVIGLIIYFHGINPLIAYPIMAVFIVSITMYLIPTCMPLVRSNFPFHTPLSVPFWWFWRMAWHNDNWKTAKTMETIREADATHTKRRERSYDAISWILRQSDEEREFAEFLDAIAGYRGKRGPSYPSGRVVVADLVEQYPAEVLLRTYTMLHSCGRFSNKTDYRATVILHAIPALAVSWHTISWKGSKAVTPQVDAQILSQWPLKMLEVIDEAVAGSKTCLAETDLILSTYRILLQIMIWAAATSGREMVKASDLDDNKLDFDHNMDNIKRMKQTEKSKFDFVVNILVSGAFRIALSRVATESSAAIVEPYLGILDFLFLSKPEESPAQQSPAKQRFSQCIHELQPLLKDHPSLHRIAASMGDDQKPTKDSSKERSRSQVPTPVKETVEKATPPASPTRPPLKRDGSENTLTDDSSTQVTSNTLKICVNDSKLHDHDSQDRNSVSTTSKADTNTK